MGAPPPVTTAKGLATNAGRKNHRAWGIASRATGTAEGETRGYRYCPQEGRNLTLPTYLCSEVSLSQRKRNDGWPISLPACGAFLVGLRRTERHDQFRRGDPFARPVVDAVRRGRPDQDPLIRVPLEPVLHDRPDVYRDHPDQRVERDSRS